MIVLDENQEKDKLKARRDTTAELFSDPPPLYPADSDPSTSQNKPLPRIPPPPQITSSNHVDIVRSEAPIKGSWTIDTSQPRFTRSGSDPRVDPSLHTKPNLRLLTYHGGIDAVVKFKGGQRAFVEATCYDGPIALTVSGREETPFHAQIKTFQGDVLIRLPHSFFGPIKCKSRKADTGLTLNNGHAPPIFSPSMQLQVIALSSIQETNSEYETSSFFLGDLSKQPSSQHDSLHWTADEVLVELDSRDRVYFFWAEESTGVAPGESSLLDSVLTRLKPLHEVLRKPWTSRGKRREMTD